MNRPLIILSLLLGPFLFLEAQVTFETHDSYLIGANPDVAVTPTWLLRVAEVVSL